MLCLESDEMTALWQNDSLTFTFCMTFSNIIPNWTIFVKEVFWSDPLFRKWRNDCIVTKRKLNFPFLTSFNPWVWNHHLDISPAISGYIWSTQAKTSSVIAIWNIFGFTHGHERVLEELSLLKIQFNTLQTHLKQNIGQYLTINDYEWQYSTYIVYIT